MVSFARPFARGASLIGLAKLVLVVVIIVYASSVTTSTNYQGERATYLSVNNGLLLLDKGYAKISSTTAAAGTSCVSPVTFSGSPQVANTLLTSADMVFDSQANTTSSSTVNTCYSVTLYVSTSIANQTQYGPVYVATGSTVTPGQMIDCKFDVGIALPPSPYAFKITVQ
jgi:hypothetical protein